MIIFENYFHQKFNDFIPFILKAENTSKKWKVQNRCISVNFGRTNLIRIYVRNENKNVLKNIKFLKLGNFACSEDVFLPYRQIFRKIYMLKTPYIVLWSCPTSKIFIKVLSRNSQLQHTFRISRGEKKWVRYTCFCHSYKFLKHFGLFFEKKANFMKNIDKNIIIEYVHTSQNYFGSKLWYLNYFPEKIFFEVEQLPMFLGPSKSRQKYIYVPYGP